MVPLKDHALVNTANVDYARQLISDVYCDHKLAPIKTKDTRPFHAVHNYVPVNELSINYMAYSSKVVINPGFLKDFYLLQLPLNNSTAVIKTGDQEFLSDCQVGSIISPSEKTSMVWNEGCQQMMVQIRKSTVERELSRLSRCELSKPLTFEPIISFDTNKRMASWWRFINFLVTDIDMGSFAHLGDAEKNNFETTVIANLLHALPHNYSALLEVSQQSIAPRHVKKAEAFMLDHLNTPINIVDLVEVSGVSARSLFDAFKRFRGVTPMKRLQHFRLDQARQALLAATSADTVTDILTVLGVTQLGRFASVYKANFGESPSETLKNNKH